MAPTLQAKGFGLQQGSTVKDLKAFMFLSKVLLQHSSRYDTPMHCFKNSYDSCEEPVSFGKVFWHVIRESSHFGPVDWLI